MNIRYVLTLCMALVAGVKSVKNDLTVKEKG
jgi:hypothetical protein